MNTSLVILVSLLALGAAQMTFSDGWEKRSASRPYHYTHQKRSVHQDANGSDDGHEAHASVDGTEMTPITNCMEQYMVEVRELHAAMMALSARLETCENAMANPLLSGSNEKISPSRF